ncbi:MAG TPA: family 43 glycosylhydrolase [Humibacter sp.]|nr:family 43 glycosylhydrolase [Humibacter sp.]
MTFESTRPAEVRPGTTFVDDTGAVAQLHGVGIQRFGDRFYAWGEDKRAGSLFTAVVCYSSADLAEWRFEGNSLVAGDGELGPDRIIERPKVLRRPDGAYVMFLHVDTADYRFARVGYAIGDNPVGPFRYVGSERPLGNVSRDIGVYQENGVGYLLSEDRKNGLHVYRLAPDHLSVEAIVATTLKDDLSHGYESPALVRHEGLYYLFGSDLTGWSTNDNKVATATDLRGPWSSWADIADPGSATFDSQVSAVVPVGDGARPAFVYVGDRWLKDDLANSPAVWLPMELSGGRARIDWVDEWRLEVPRR